MSVCCPDCGHEFTPVYPLNRLQKRIYDYLVRHERAFGYMPTYDEICRRFGYRSLATVHEHLTNIRDAGWITWEHNKKGSIVLLVRKDSA